ncbi:MAG: FAD-dependent thymidylate synthase [Patescibacteria group bacterium]|nr:FAD-dependent thymidylate synthase [Patescibacteria group bacterium]
MPNATIPDAVLDHARRWMRREVAYRFTKEEERVLRIFFTNIDRNVFFLRGLPANVQATIASMYSRMKNPRGLRGVFVDSFLPLFLSSLTAEALEGEEAFLRERRIRNLGDFIAYSAEAKKKYEEFVRKVGIDPGYFEVFSEAEKAKRFLSSFLDQFGHNSIARMASVAVCAEEISVLAAKSMEWNRPGSGYIELSTRYVDVSSHGRYPTHEEFVLYGDLSAATLTEVYTSGCFDAYRYQIGENFDGPFPTYLRDNYRSPFRNEQEQELGVRGEACDVLGNLLPSSTLTSVCAVVSGEALPMLVKHLLLDNLPETVALAEEIVFEAKKGGAGQFVSNPDRYTPTASDTVGWNYLSVDKFIAQEGKPRILMPSAESCESVIHDLLQMKEGFDGSYVRAMILDSLYPDGRRNFDKLPREFESVAITYLDAMSLRGWRDVQRQGFAGHRRTYLTPFLGFYHYPKSHPDELYRTFSEIRNRGLDVYREFKRVPVNLRQYALPMGFLIGYAFTANLREAEFCIWQRTKPSVNDEVRQQFLRMDKLLGERLHLWWNVASRTDRTPHYLFARGPAISLSSARKSG